MAQVKLSKEEFDLAGGDISKIASIQSSQKAMKDAKADAETSAADAIGREAFSDGLIINGILFYSPTLAHKWFIEICLKDNITRQKELRNNIVLSAVYAFILATPSEELTTTIYSFYEERSIGRMAVAWCASNSISRDDAERVVAKLVFQLEDVVEGEKKTEAQSIPSGGQIS